MIPRYLFLAWLMATVCHAQATVTGPQEVDVGRSVWLEVEGISVAELQAGETHVFPQGADVELRTLQDLSGTILIWFRPNEPGQFDILVIVPIMVGEAAGLKSALWTIQAGEVPPINPPPKPPPSTKISQVTYVYEKDRNAVPRGVSAALRTLNDDAAYSGILASEFEEDTLDGDGGVPEQYQIALSAAKEAGLPALVFQAGDEVVKVIKAPTTTEQVLEVFK